MGEAISVVNLVLLLVVAGCLVHDRRRCRSMMRLLELHLCLDRPAWLDGAATSRTPERPEDDQIFVHQLRARISSEISSGIGPGISPDREP
jgi:hypothetical protein